MECLQIRLLGWNLGMRLDAGSFLFNARTTSMILLIHSHSFVSHGGFRCSQPMRPTSCSGRLVCDADTFDLHFLNGLRVACLLKNTPPNIWGEMSNKYNWSISARGSLQGSNWSDVREAIFCGHSSPLVRPKRHIGVRASLLVQQLSEASDPVVYLIHPVYRTSYALRTRRILELETISGGFVLLKPPT